MGLRICIANSFPGDAAAAAAAGGGRYFEKHSFRVDQPTLEI